ncbi:MAG: tRNA pseudouridine(38-40) synthase TruA [Limnobacter sp.]|nr:tRNA pseudouridine(38-40) synthase TruA [Limnobacter sp.]
MPRVVLGVAYLGGAFEGWQTQPHGRTVQDHLLHCLERINGEPLQLFCAGRTDTGVHARRQVVHFDTNACRPASAWTKGVNQFLPDDISVTGAVEKDDSFHARFSAVSRTYRYYFYCASARDPFKQTMTWVHYPLDLDAMQKAAEVFVGTHDFSAIRAAQCQAKSPVRTIYSIRLVQNSDHAYFEIHGNAFLHHMIRNLMGVLFEVGLGRKPLDWAQQVLDSRRRENASRTYPAQGLVLWNVKYPDEFQVDQLFQTSFQWA